MVSALFFDTLIDAKALSVMFRWDNPVRPLMSRLVSALWSANKVSIPGAWPNFRVFSLGFSDILIRPDSAVFFERSRVSRFFWPSMVSFVKPVSSSMPVVLLN